MREKDVNLPCRIFAILVMLFLLAPLVVIVIASFTPTALITFPPQGFSLKWYANIFGSSTHFMDGLVNSLKIGILATAADILALIQEVQRRVLAEKGVMLQPEVKLLDA